MTIADTCSLSKKFVSVESVLALNWTFRNFSAEPLWVKSASWFFSFIAYLITSVDFRMLDDTFMQVRSDFAWIRIIRLNLLYFLKIKLFEFCGCQNFWFKMFQLIKAEFLSQFIWLIWHHLLRKTSKTWSEWFICWNLHPFDQWVRFMYRRETS